MKNGWQRFAASRSVSNAPKGYRRYHASLAVPAASVAAASVKPAATTVKAATATMEATAAAVEATTATMEAATAVEAISTAESTVVETAAMKAAIKATATVETSTKATATVEAATKETITVPEAKAPPRSCADENAALKPVRAVIAVRRAVVWRIVVVPIGAGGRAVIDGPSKSNAEGDALGIRVRSREETDTEKNTEQTEEP
jgi:cytoskeletal protein RodZ